MTSRTKELITLTDINVQDNRPEIAITMKGGLHSLKGITVHQNVWETIGFLACELAMAPAVIRDIAVKGPADLMLFFHFAIDSGLALKMATQYQEMGNCDLTRMSEDIINGFDEVNGNNAVSQAVGIAHLVKKIQSDEVDLGERVNPITRMAEILFKQDPWDHNNQGVNVIEGKLTALGEDIEFTTSSAVGNVYVEGKIGKMGVRIFKAQNVQVYIGWGTNHPDRPEVFQLYEEEKLIQRLYDAVEISAHSPA